MNARIVSLLAVGCAGMFLNCGDPVSSDPEPTPTLAPGQGITILEPNGGETYNYGDTMTVRFLQNTNVSIEAVVAFGPAGSAMATDFNGQESAQWQVFPRDTATAQNPTKYYQRLPGQDSVWMGVYKFAIADKDIWGTILAMRDSMFVKVWDPYTNVCDQCKQGDVSDGTFFIRRP